MPSRVKGTTIRLHPSGESWDLSTPRAALIHVEDLACSLSKLCRFNGMIPAFYSVAQHSVLVLDLIAGRYPDYDDLPVVSTPNMLLSEARVRLHRRALLHDAHEAYLGDVTAPMKALLRKAGSPLGLSSPLDFYARLHDEAVAQRFNLSSELGELFDKSVDAADLAAYDIESAALWGRAPLSSLPERRPLDPEAAEALFLSRAQEVGVA